MASPGSTLACPAYPIIALGAPRYLMSQWGSPGSEFSLTGRRGDGVTDPAGAPPPGAPPPGPVIRVHAAAAADTAAETRPRKARREGRECGCTHQPWHRARRR